MPCNEGFVATLKENGRAEVVIRPESAGIPGPSNRVNRHVCHCATGGSTVMIEALNGVGAEVGDYVSVRREASGLVKNAVCLLGVPLVGLILGIILAALLNSRITARSVQNVRRFL